MRHALVAHSINPARVAALSGLGCSVVGAIAFSRGNVLGFLMVLAGILIGAGAAVAIDDSEGK